MNMLMKARLFRERLSMINIEDSPNEIRELMRKLLALLEANREKTYTYEISAAEVSILHGLVRFAEIHPEVRKLSENTQDAIFCFREFCKEVWQEMGLTAEEATALDELREQW